MSMELTGLPYNLFHSTCNTRSAQIYLECLGSIESQHAEWCLHARTQQVAYKNWFVVDLLRYKLWNFAESLRICHKSINLTLMIVQFWWPNPCVLASAEKGLSAWLPLVSCYTSTLFCPWWVCSFSVWWFGRDVDFDFSGYVSLQFYLLKSINKSSCTKYRMLWINIHIYCYSNCPDKNMLFKLLSLAVAIFLNKIQKITSLKKRKVDILYIWTCVK